MKPRLTPLLLVLAGLLFSEAVAAHADLVEAQPPPNSRVDAAPAELVLLFSEPVEPGYTRVQATDANGTNHARPTETDPSARSRVRVPLQPMADGVYTVRWRALSYDTHTTSGIYLVAVNASFGELPPDLHAGHRAGAGHTGVSPSDLPEAAARALGLGGAALAAGIPLFWLVVLRPLRLGPTDAPGSTPARAAPRSLLVAALAGALVGAGGGLGLLAAMAGRIETDLAGALATGPGRFLGLRALLLLGAAGLLARTLRAADPFRALLFAAAAALASLGAVSLASHAAAETEGRALALGADFVHQVAASFWVAGVVSIWLLARARSEPRWLARLIARFSPYAVAAVATIVSSGAYSSLLHLERFEDLWTTAYGLALLTKTALLVPLLVLGAVHRYRLAPRLERGDGPGPTRRLTGTLAMETLAFSIVLVAAGVLTNAAPPASAPPSHGGEDLEGLVRSFEGGGLNVSLAIHPAPPTVGFQHLLVVVRAVDGGPPPDVAAFLVLHPPSDPHGDGTLVELLDSGRGTFEKTGAFLTEPGAWRAALLVQGPETFVREEFPITVEA